MAACRSVNNPVTRWIQGNSQARPSRVESRVEAVRGEARRKGESMQSDGSSGTRAVECGSVGHNIECIIRFRRSAGAPGDVRRRARWSRMRRGPPSAGRSRVDQSVREGGGWVERDKSSQ